MASEGDKEDTKDQTQNINENLSEHISLTSMDNAKALDEPTSLKPEEEEKYTNKMEDATITQHDNKSKLITILLDKDQEIPRKVPNWGGEHDDDDFPTLPTDHPMNPTMGDVELREIRHTDGEIETLWFQIDPDQWPSDDDGAKIEKGKKKKKRRIKPRRKLFVSLKVKRISDVDSVIGSVKHSSLH